MLIIMHNEGDSLKQMAEILNRRDTEIKKVIITLFKKG
jgi:predicted transcriptional regulator